MKYCKNCGKELKEGAKFCPSCGSAVSAQNNAPGFEKTGAGKIQSGLDAVKTSRQDSLNPSQAFCKNCGAPLKEGAKFCPKCGSLTGLPVRGNLNKNLEPSKDIPPAADISNKAGTPSTTQPFEIPRDEIKPLSKDNNLAKNEYLSFSRDKLPKSKLVPLLYGIIPVLIVAGITVFLYETGRLPFISRVSSSQKHILLKKEKVSPKKNTFKKTNKTVKAVGKASKNKTKAVKNIAYIYPKKAVKPPAHSPYAPSRVNEYPHPPVYHASRSRIAFNTLRTDFGIAGTKIISFLPKHVSGQSSISFVIISHVYSFASNVSADSTEMFKVEFTATVPKNINVPSVKIVSKIGGQNGFVAKNISFANLSSSGVYTVGIPVRMPAYLTAGSYYFNAKVEAPGISLTSGNAYFRVE